MRAMCLKGAVCSVQCSTTLLGWGRPIEPAFQRSQIAPRVLALKVLGNLSKFKAEATRQAGNCPRFAQGAATITCANEGPHI